MRTKIVMGLTLMVLVPSARAQLRGGLLPEDQAFKVSASLQSPGVAVVSFKIAPDYYLYRGQMKFLAGDGVTLANVTLPPGEMEHDQYLGDVVIYHGSVAATVPFMASHGTTRVDLIVGYQGCHEVVPKLCYPPTSQTFTLTLPTQGQSRVGTETGMAPNVVVARPVVAAYTKPGDAQSGTSGRLAKPSDRYSGTPQAQAAVKAGDAAKQSAKVDEAIQDYQNAITLDPNYWKGQSQYIHTENSKYFLELLGSPTQITPAMLKKMSAGGGMSIAAKKDQAIHKELIRKYTALATQHPNAAIYPWVLGQLYDSPNLADLARQKSYCEQALHIDAEFAQGWECLSHIAMVRTQRQQAIDYMGKAFELAPDNEDVANRYAGLLIAFGKPTHQQIRSLMRSFPKSGSIAHLLTSSADLIDSEQGKIDTLEMLFKDASSVSSPLASSAADYLYSDYIGSDLLKAQILARKMAIPGMENKTWSLRLKYVNGLIEAQRDVDAGRPKAALAGLKLIKSFSGETGATTNRWYLMDAEALDLTGRTADAIAALRKQFVRQPTDSVLRAMYTYGKKVGMSEHAINDGVWAVLETNAKAAHPFTLKRLDGQGSASLSDYRGKPVIIDFWFPTCEACREAFPYLQKVAVELKSSGLTVLAVNGVTSQQPFAFPYLRGMGYDFVGLEGDHKFVNGDYGVIAFPTTFFVGPDGKILFELPLFDSFMQQSAATAVKFMLTRAQT